MITPAMGFLFLRSCIKLYIEKRSHSCQRFLWRKRRFALIFHPPEGGKARLERENFDRKVSFIDTTSSLSVCVFKTMVVNLATPTEQTSSSIDSRGTMGKQGSSQSSSAANQSSSSITPGKLRRQISVPIDDRLEDPTAVQRLVEYFVVVSCKPRLDPASSKPSSPPKPQKDKRDVDGGNQAKKTEEIKKKMHDGTKRFNESIHNAFKKREVTGAESAIRRTFSEEPESRKRCHYFQLYR